MSLMGPGSKSSSSSSSQANTTSKNIDMRIAADAGSSNASSYVDATNSTVTVVDAGAVQSAFGFASEVTRDAFNQAAASQMDTNKTLNEALDSVEKAYADAKQGEQKILTAVGLAVVAMVAVKTVKG